jgi:Xaa-Pro aminopeptidase
MRFLLVFSIHWLIFLSFFSYSQEFKNNIQLSGKSNYEEDLLPPSFFENRRDQLRKLMPNGSVAVFFSSPLKNRSNDVDYEFHQDPNFLYFTGIREPNAVLVIFKDFQNELDSFAVNEVIFLEETNPKKQIWNGPTIGCKKAVSLYKLKSAKANVFFENTPIDWKKFNQVFIDKYQKGAEDDPYKTYDLFNLQENLKLKLEKEQINVNLSKLGEFTSILRQKKTLEEIKLMKKACLISCKGFVELMRALEPGMKEYQTEAIMEYYFKNNGAEFEGYPSICGASENSVILHYSTNRRSLNDGDLIVVDAGAEYHGYTADITRTLPVNGKYSEVQRIIYNIVLEAQQAGIEACRPGANFWDAHSAASAVIKRRLLETGIIKSESDYIKYFMHGTSHYLGLDVHDCGLYQKLEPGMIITVEPGIYISEGSDCDPKWWNIGVRIEDDVLITEKSCEVISDYAPKSPDAIEALMKENSLLHKLSK